MLAEYLYSRKVRDFSPIFLADECVYFKLWNLSGQLVGVQRHSPNGIKVSKSCETARKRGDSALNELRYLTYVSKGQIGIFGLHTYRVNQLLFITEGVFDAIMIHNAGYSAIAVLSNDCKPFRSWLNTLPNIKIAILDNDPTGVKLAKFGDIAYKTPDPYKDLNEMPQDEVDQFIFNIAEANGYKIYF